MLPAGALVLALCAGCNLLSGTPELLEPRIVPDALHPGDTAVISLRVVDRHRLVRKIEGQVQGQPRHVFRLLDDGVGPDEAPGDGIWSMQVDVPFQAPSGDFVLEFTAYKSDGLPVPVRDGQHHVVSLRTSLPLTIEAPEKVAPASP